MEVYDERLQVARLVKVPVHVPKKKVPRFAAGMQCFDNTGEVYGFNRLLSKLVVRTLAGGVFRRNSVAERKGNSAM